MSRAHADRPTKSRLIACWHKKRLIPVRGSGPVHASYANSSIAFDDRPNGSYWPRLCKNSMLFRIRGSSDQYPTRNNRIQRVLEGRCFKSRSRFAFLHSLGHELTFVDTAHFAGKRTCERAQLN